MCYRVRGDRLAYVGRIGGLKILRGVKPQLGYPIGRPIITGGDEVEHEATNTRQLRRQWCVLDKPPVSELLMRDVGAASKENDGFKHANLLDRLLDASAGTSASAEDECDDHLIGPRSVTDAEVSCVHVVENPALILVADGHRDR